MTETDHRQWREISTELSSNTMQNRVHESLTGKTKLSCSHGMMGSGYASHNPSCKFIVTWPVNDRAYAFLYSL